MIFPLFILYHNKSVIKFHQPLLPLHLRYIAHFASSCLSVWESDLYQTASTSDNVTLIICLKRQYQPCFCCQHKCNIAASHDYNIIHVCFDVSQIYCVWWFFSLFWWSNIYTVELSAPFFTINSLATRGNCRNGTIFNTFKYCIALHVITMLTFSLLLSHSFDFHPFHIFSTIFYRISGFIFFSFHFPVSSYKSHISRSSIYKYFHQFSQSWSDYTFPLSFSTKGKDEITFS